jgi:hypothetical protein
MGANEDLKEVLVLEKKNEPLSRPLKRKQTFASVYKIPGRSTI